MYVTCTAHDLLLVVNKLPRMHTLEVSDLHFPPQPVMDLRGAADANWIVASKALKTLHVVSCSRNTMDSVQSFRPFWELINAFSYIEELHVSYVVQVFTRLEDMWTESIADLTTIPLVCNRRTHVERLYICSWTSAMRFASHFLDLTQLSHMEIVPSLSWQDLSGLFSVASHLKHLRMELTDSALSRAYLHRLICYSLSDFEEMLQPILNCRISKHAKACRPSTSHSFVIVTSRTWIIYLPIGNYFAPSK